MRYEITLDCPECEGFGYFEHQRSATLYINRTCPECAGERYKVWIIVNPDFADYPDAVSIKPIAEAYHV
jgi:ribosomal protein L33